MSKKFFQAIKAGNITLVREMLQKQPTLLTKTAKAPPKTDDGQSPLQIAIRNQQLEIADFFLDCGADVDFMESESCCNDWRMPVLQDAITCAVMQSRWNTVSPDGALNVFSTAEKADAAYRLLKRMLELGAYVHCRDSYGNSCLNRAILSTRQILPKYDHSAGTIRNGRAITDDLRSDLLRIFRLLLSYGADFMECDRYTQKPLIEHYQAEPVSEFLRIGIK